MSTEPKSFETLVREKTDAGLPLADAELVVRKQLAHDKWLESQEAFRKAKAPQLTGSPTGAVVLSGLRNQLSASEEANAKLRKEKADLEVDFLKLSDANKELTEKLAALEADKKTPSTSNPKNPAKA